MNKDIEKIVATCEVCLKHDKVPIVNNQANATHIDNIFDRWGIDVVNGLPLSEHGYSSILVVVEYLTKFAWAFPLKHKSAQEIAQHLTTLICSFGPPKTLLSDQGKEFFKYFD